MTICALASHKTLYRTLWVVERCRVLYEVPLYSVPLRQSQVV